MCYGLLMPMPVVVFALVFAALGAALVYFALKALQALIEPDGAAESDEPVNT